MLWWADIPDGQRGLYGSRGDVEVSGIYAEFRCDLVDDIDPLAGGKVMASPGGSTSDKWRIVRPQGATPTIGLGGRWWLSQLPDDDANGIRLYIWRSVTNAQLAYLTVTSTGRLRMVITGGATYDSTLPNITANGYYHIEAKYTHGAGALCSFEVRVEGTSIAELTQTNVAGTNADPAQTAWDQATATGVDGVYVKDTIFWDGTGGEFDDFQGSVQVHDLYTDEDVSLGGWTTSTGATGWPLIQDKVPSNTLTLTGAISVDDDKVSMNAVYYQWAAGSVDAGTPAGTSANPWKVAYGGTDAQALINLFAAVNASGVAGTTYSTALTQNAQIEAAGYGALQLDVQARDGETESWNFTEDGANMNWRSSSSLTGGPTDNSYISADDTPPAASEFRFTPLPVDVTSVRGLISIQRAYKTDGGDAQLQVSLSTNGVDYDAGADRTLTTAPTWYFDVSVLDADTGNPYLPSAVDTLQALIDRTV
jgi:hypothetical protein